MKEKNNPLWLTERYLKDYRGQKRYIALLESEINDRYETATSMVAMYGEHIGHSSVEKLHVGAMLAIDSDFQAKQTDLKEAKKIVETIEQGNKDLSPAEWLIIQRRYLDPKPSSWTAISLEVKYSERNCRRFLQKALQYFATALFGIKVVLNSEKKQVG